MSSNSQLMAVVGRLMIRRPGLVFEALRFALASAPHRWYLRPPFLPLPEAVYRDWRLTTAHGTPDASVTVGELEEFLEWRRTMRRASP